MSREGHAAMAIRPGVVDSIEVDELLYVWADASILLGGKSNQVRSVEALCWERIGSRRYAPSRKDSNAGDLARPDNEGKTLGEFRDV